MGAHELEDRLILSHRLVATILTIKMHECFEIVDASRESYTRCEFSMDISCFADSIVHFHSDICRNSLRREVRKGEKEFIVA